MKRTNAIAWVVALLLALPGLAAAQTTTSGAQIDIEVYNADGDGSSLFCAEVGVPFWAYVYVRPGTGTTSCSALCGSVAGGSANLATAALDIQFDPAMLGYGGAESNAATAAQDGLIQTQSVASGRFGWALAGDFMTNGDPNSGLQTPCDSMLLDADGWVLRVAFTPLVAGSSTIVLRTPPDFQLSFADLCGSGPFVPGAGIDEVVSATVDTQCIGTGIFADGFESSDTSAWSAAVP